MKLKKYREYIFGKKYNISDEYIKTYVKNTKPIVNLRFILSIIINLEKLIIISIFSYLLILRKILIEDFFIYIQAYNETKSTITRFFDIYTSLSLNNEYIKKFINMKSIANVESRQEVDFIEGIYVKNLSFSYNSRKKLLTI